MAHSPRFGCPPISRDDVAGIENEVQEYLRKSPRVFIAEPCIPVSTVRDVLQEKLNIFPYRISFL